MTKAYPTNLVSVDSLSVTNGLRDIKPPVEIPSGYGWLWWVLGVLVVVALAYFLWRYWQKRRAHTPPVPQVPPHVRARQRLSEALAFIHQPREFCVLVSDAARWYLEERFEFHAPERTTEEFLYELKGTGLLSEGQKNSLGEFLQRCDLVKFAKYEPREPELRELHGAACRLVDETAPAEPASSTGPGSSAQEWQRRPASDSPEHS